MRTPGRRSSRGGGWPPTCWRVCGRSPVEAKLSLPSIATVGPGDRNGGIPTIEHIAEKQGIARSALQARAKKLCWLREPGETKRQMVEAKLTAGSGQQTGQQTGQAQQDARAQIEAEAYRVAGRWLRHLLHPRRAVANRSIRPPSLGRAHSKRHRPLRRVRAVLHLQQIPAVLRARRRDYPPQDVERQLRWDWA